MAAYRRDIDGLRAVAVVPVVMFHADIPLFSGGFVGVDVFFVVSGFLIAGLLGEEIAAGRFSLIGFYDRRARRILPALAAVLLACLAAGLLLSSPDQLTDLAESTLATVLFSSNLWFLRFSTGYFAADVEIQPLLHTWSLAVEEQFYLVFPVLLWALSSFSRRTTLRILAGLCLGSFVLALAGVVMTPAATFYLAPTRAWELGLGVLLALGAFPGSRHRPAVQAAALAGLLAILGSMIIYDASTPFPGLAAAIPCVGAAAIIWAGTQRETWTGRALSVQPMVYVGLLSYSLYLWHWPVLAFAKQAAGTATLAPALAGLLVIASFAASALSLAYIERPFRRRPPDGFSRATIVRASSGALALVAALAVGVWYGDGLTGRFGRDVRLAFAGARDVDPERRRCMGRSPPGELCAIGSPAEGEVGYDFLLWGDSHAGSIKPAIDVVARQSDRRGLFAGTVGCPPLLGLVRIDDAERDCAGWNEAVLAMLEARDDMPLVILSARWALWAEGSRPPGEGATALLSEIGSVAAPGPERNFGHYRAALLRTVAAIRETRRQVVLIGGVPEIGWSVPEELGQSLQFGRTPPLPPTLGDVSKRNERADAVLQLAAWRNDATFVPVAPGMCRPIREVARRGRPLYSDSNHLSLYGAKEILAPLLKDALWGTLVATRGTEASR